MTGPKPRVFVSSVVEAFQDFRKAARLGIEAAGGEPLLVNEDLPSVPSSSRNACLDVVDSSDYLLSIVATRGGWSTPSGRLVIEEEYDRAVQRKIPVLGFIQAGKLDVDAARFAGQLSDYTTGQFRRTFDSPAALQSEIERALRPLISAEKSVTIPRSARDPFSKPYSVQGMAMLRFVLTPEREEEVIDPVRLASEPFKRGIHAIGHSGEVGLLSYERPKRAVLEKDDLVINQTEPNGGNGGSEYVRLQLSESGELWIDSNVTGRTSRGSSFMDAHVVAIEDVEDALRRSFAFAFALYQDLDAPLRHQSFSYNAALSGLDYRKLERSPKGRTSFTMNMGQHKAVLVAYPAPRRVSRADLAAPDGEIERAVELLRRKSENS